jgi:serine/threonine protein kinase
MDERQARNVRTLAGRYELGPLLGRGGMGEVREATDRRLDRAVAVKILRHDLAEQPRARRRFEAEAHAAARLLHPNVVMVFDSGEDDDIPFLVMERLPGRTLADELLRGPADVDRVRDVAREILAALGAAHAAGVIHRDIKPGNVLLTADGHVKVGDFGIAKTVDDPDQTHTVELVATPAYLAPERLAGEPASKQSDLYSVGVLLYEALVGRRPFAGDTSVAMMRAIEQGSPTPIASAAEPRTIPVEVVTAIERAMARDPHQRFDSAEAMAGALEQPPSLVTEPISSRDGVDTVRIEAAPRDGAQTQHLPIDRPITGRRIARRFRRRVGVGAGVVLVAVGGVGVFEIHRGSDHPAGSPSSTSTTPTATPVSGRLPAPLETAIRKLEQAIDQ